MAITFISGVEMGTLGEFDTTSGTVSASTTQKNTGAYSVRCNPTSSYGYVRYSSTTETRISFYLYIATSPNSDAKIFGVSSGYWGLVLTTDGYIDLYESTTKRVDGTTQLSTGTWYRISLTVNSSDGHAYYWIDGVAEGDYDGSNTSLSTTLAPLP